MDSQPPVFENKATCYKCSSSFGLVKRKHHCRNCGKTVCGECSQKTIALPHYNITEQVRVCEACFNTIQQQMALASHNQSLQQQQHQQQQQQASNLVHNSNSSNNATSNNHVLSSQSSASISPQPIRSPMTSSFNQFNTSANSNSFSGFGRSSAPAYDLHGNLNDQLRHAIKNGDIAGVKQLLDAGADCNYVDPTKNSLLHIAAMFDKIDIAKLLMDKGANINAKNSQGESPLDIAPTAMAFKMKEVLASRAA